MKSDPEISFFKITQGRMNFAVLLCDPTTVYMLSDSLKGSKIVKLWVHYLTCDLNYIAKFIRSYRSYV